MSNLKVLKYNEIVMTVLGIYSRPPHVSCGLRWLHSIMPYYTIVCMIVSFTLSVMYVMHESARLSYVFEACTIGMGSYSGLFASLNMKWKANKAGDVQSKLQKIADKGIKLLWI